MKNLGPSAGAMPAIHSHDKRYGSLKSVLARIAIVAAGAVVFVAPQAQAQENCSITGTTETCTGAVDDSIFRPLPSQAPPNTLHIRNLTRSFSPLPVQLGSLSWNTGGIRLLRENNAAPPLTLTLDNTVDLTLTTQPAVATNAVSVIDRRFSGVSPSVVVVSGATITLNSQHNAPTRGQYFNRTGEITDSLNAIAIINRALAIPNLDEFIEDGFGFGFDFFLLDGDDDPDNDFDFETGWQQIAQNFEIQEQILAANCLLRPGLPGNYYGSLCQILPMPTDPAVFRQEAAQFIMLREQLIDYLESAVSPEEATDRWRTALSARSEGHGVRSGDVSITNTGIIATSGDFAFGILGTSQSYGNQTSTGGVTITHDGSIVTSGDSSVGVAAISQGPLTSSHQTPGNAGLAAVEGDGTITTTGASAYGIWAAAFGGSSVNDRGDQPAGNGGTVDVSFGGDIATGGYGAIGIYAVSQGGRGGNGNNADVEASEAGGIGGYGGAVSVEVLEGGSVVTTGFGAHAISANAIGGDGGKGGSDSEVRDASRGGAGGNGGTVEVTNDGLLWTEGGSAHGIFANSFAGAGGLGGNGESVFRGRGGDGGEAGEANAVTVTNNGLIHTQGQDSFGIFAQSVGGIAGNGGDASGAFTSNAGDGGTSQTERCTNLLNPICPNGGEVTVTNNGRIETLGNFSHSIFAQSVGGGGGNAGDASGWVNVSGGDGGSAGHGSTVTIDNYGELETTGLRSAGIFAQSVGGGGGSGGDSNSIGQLVAVAIGGDGGAGGNGGNLTVINHEDGSIYTAGERSDGIFVQSVGGGGGSGGDANALAWGGIAAAVSIGGTGGGGGNGGQLVRVENHGVIDTAGDFSNGIFAQSIGGGGGVGGAAYSFAIAVNVDVAVGASLAFGGDGGDGGHGYKVEIENTGSIITREFNSMGILAQSIGGGGGAGGSSTARAIAGSIRKGAAVSFTLAVGGDGGAGGNGGIVDVDNQGMVVTFGDGSTGILAQSVGGGGGVGGDATATSEAVAGGNASEVKVSVSLGGSGGDGGDGGEVYVTNSGMVITMGDIANGITAQSIGGGGGMGGAGVQGDLFEDMGIPDMPGFDDIEGDTSRDDRENGRNRYRNLQNNARNNNPRSNDSIGRNSKSGGKNGGSGSIQVGVNIGGSGGNGGNGDNVYVNNTGEIITAGFMSMGVLAQSIGGGGGAGGGGQASASGDLGVGAANGGDGAPGGNGGEVWVANEGDITTLGEMSIGILAQSIGGGGGAGGIGESEAEELYNITVTIGGEGGYGGTGALVDVEQTGNILTYGYGSYGIFAQSVGGGGGIGGSATQGSFLSVSIGGDGGAGGGTDPNEEILDSGGTVDVYVDGNVTTEGDFAHAVYAQSVGGGGGVASGVATETYVHEVDSFGLIQIDTGLTIGVGTFGIGGSGGVGGHGGEVIVTTEGTITTLGTQAHGIFAQSIGGGGGSGGSGGATLPLAVAMNGSNGDTGHGGTITINHTGSIRTFGDGSVGIYAQSTGGTNADDPNGANDARLGDDITITLTSGEIIGGDNGGAGIFIAAGRDNTITNIGGRISALSGNAIIATDGNDTIYNRGLIDGNIGLGGGLNALFNERGGVLQTRQAIYLGANARLTNSGVISPYGAEEVGQSLIVGNLVQGATGDLLVDLNFGGASDLITVQGSATLAGTVTPIVDHATDLEAGTWTTILQATSLIDNGISINLHDTLVIDYASRFQGNQFQIGIASIDFEIDGLSGQQGEVAGHLGEIREKDTSGGFDALLDALVYETDADVYMALLDDLHPYGAFSQGSHPITYGQGNLGAMMSCPQTEGWVKPWREQSCTWVRGVYGKTEQDAVDADPGYTNKSAGLQMGHQLDLGGGWFAGYSIGYEGSSFTSGPTTASSSDSLHLGGAIKRQFDNLLLAAAVDAAHTSTDRHRLTGFPTLMLATSDNATTQLSVRLRAAATAELGAFYLRPVLDIDGYTVRTGGFEEDGAGVYNMVVADAEQTLGSGTLSLGAGYVQDMGDWTLHPFAEIGITRLTDESLDLSARFQGATSGVSDFTVSSVIPKELTGGRIGLEALMPLGSLRLEYEHKEGDGFLNRSASAKVRFEF